MVTKVKDYDASSIKHLTGREAVRAKPEMYIGPIDGQGIFTICREVLDNVCDEALAGHCDQGDFYLDEDGSYWVIDNGRGMPVGNMKVKDSVTGQESTMPAIQAITSLLHAGGKLDTHGSAYSVSIGTHGVGQKSTNFLSDFFEVKTFNKGEWYTIGYEKGELTQPLKKLKVAPNHPFRGEKLKRGTLVHFSPDLSIFSEKKFSNSLLLEWAQMKAYFTPGFKVTIGHHSGKTRDFYAEAGPSQFVVDRVAKLKCNPIQGHEAFSFSNALVDCVFQFTDYDGCELLSFTNGLHNAERGVHFNAFFASLLEAIQPFVKKKQEFTPAELREGIVGLVNVKLSAPKFASQTKEKLTDERGGAPVSDFLIKEFASFFKKNRALAEAICERCARLKALKSQFVASKKVLTALRGIAKKGLPAKAAVAPNCRPEERELFIVEGDSASGSLKGARDPRYQEGLPIRGKILNSMKDPNGKALESEEVLNILAQIGFDPKAEDPLSKLRVGKIICLADPDPDGPLLGETPVSVKWENEWYNLTMEALARAPWVNREYKTVSWNGSSFCLGDAYDCRITEYTDELLRFELSNGKFEVCSPKHQFALYSTKFTDRGIYTGTGLRMVQASEFKAGDRIVAIADNEGTFDPVKAVAGKKLEFVTINKIKRKVVEPTPMYCLTVHGYHNFVLNSGIISKNCHINALLLSLFYKYLPDLFNRGMIYCAQVPEYYAIAKDGRSFFGERSADVQAQLTNAGVKAEVCHCKGYGEVDADVLRVLAFDPSTRKLAKILAVDSADSDVEFRMLMGGGSDSRKKLLGI